MLYSLRGTVVFCDSAFFAIECGGVAYLCQTSLGTLSKIGKLGSEVVVYTYMNIRENALDLFAFADQNELSCFKMLIAINGVGPKAALSILSNIPPERVALNAAAGDFKAFTCAPGIGAKLAQRIVLELKDKFSNEDIAGGVASQQIVAGGGMGNISEAISALVVLGYSQTEAASAISSQPKELAVEELVKLGLKALSSRR